MSKYTGTWDILFQLNQKILGADGDEWRELLTTVLEHNNPSQLHAAIKRLDGKESAKALFPGSPVVHQAVVERITVRVATQCKSGAEYLQALAMSNCILGKWVRLVLLDSRFQQLNEEELKIVLLSWDDLGLLCGAHRETVFERGHHLGLRLCPLGAAAQLRLDYDQPMRTKVAMAMEPIRIGAKGVADYFLLEKNKKGTTLNGLRHSTQNLRVITKWAFVDPT